MKYLLLSSIILFLIACEKKECDHALSEDAKNGKCKLTYSQKNALAEVKKNKNFFDKAKKENEAFRKKIEREYKAKTDQNKKEE